jgi:uncharacterized membrane protein YeaQ/YmgE (transglycosylase-associated protein family)
MIMAAISWIVFGLIVGFIARALYPGKQKMSLPATIALGIAGSVVGGLIAWGLGYGAADGRGPFEGAGWIMSIVGGLIVVWAAMAMSRPRADHIS